MKVKKLFMLIVIAVLMFQVSGQESGIKFFQGNWDQLLKAAQKQNRIIFVDAFAEWCGPCKKMARDVFTLDNVGSYYNIHFVNYKLDMEKGEGLDVAKKYGVKVYPTYLFISASGELVHRAVGSMEAADFISLGETALDPKNNLAAFSLEYKNGLRNPEFLLKYAMMLKKAYMDAKEVSDAYFKTQEEGVLIENQNWEAIKTLTDDMDSREFRYLLTNKQAFINRYKAQPVEEKISKVVMSAAYSKFKANREIQVEQLLDEILFSNGVENPEKLQLEISMAYFSNMNPNWEHYMGLAEEYVHNYLLSNIENSSEINEIAWNFYLHVDDHGMLQRALEWVRRGIEIDDNYYIYDTYSALLFKLGNNDEAIDAAKRAVEIAKNNNLDFSGTEKLMKDIRERETKGKTEKTW